MHLDQLWHLTFNAASGVHLGVYLWFTLKSGSCSKASMKYVFWCSNLAMAQAAPCKLNFPSTFAKKEAGWILLYDFYVPDAQLCQVMEAMTASYSASHLRNEKGSVLRISQCFSLFTWCRLPYSHTALFSCFVLTGRKELWSKHRWAFPLDVLFVGRNTAWLPREDKLL